VESSGWADSMRVCEEEEEEGEEGWERETRVLITTDFLPKRIDDHQVSLVIDCEMPIKKESCIPPIGRSARFGRKGIAINLVTDEDGQMLKDIQEFYKAVVEKVFDSVKDVLL
jgi:superfamily II DNA/RNA helicase